MVYGNGNTTVFGAVLSESLDHQKASQIEAFLYYKVKVPLLILKALDE
jgi:hypothetical protein